MVDYHVFAGLGEEALLVFASADLVLVFTGWGAEIGGRTADVVDIALKIGLFHHSLCLCDY